MEHDDIVTNAMQEQCNLTVAERASVVINYGQISFDAKLSTLRTTKDQGSRPRTTSLVDVAVAVGLRRPTPGTFFIFRRPM